MDELMVTASGAELRVRLSQNDGEPLLLLHGGPGVPDSMQTTIGPLLSEFRCISFDQRGVGESVGLDGDYQLRAYLEDIEAIRECLATPSWHVLGHSWGGLLAQAYTAAYPQRVTSLVLSSSSLGVGADWKRTKHEAFRTDRIRAGAWGTLRFLAFGSGLVLPDPLRAWSMRHVMTETWHNYFLDSRAAPDPPRAWLDGCSAKASDIVRRRLPQAAQVTLEGSGHLHWLQNPSGYESALRRFYASAGARPL